MCGIVGYVGTKAAEPILIDGLRKLEYRGYDSAGLAFLQDGQFNVVRAQGKLGALVERLKGHAWPATIGIGHTRWATHGRPSEANAHPHQSRDVVLVHNGIIENYLTLRSDLAKMGHTCSSETDSEVVCHLIQEHLNSGKNFMVAFQTALAQIRGAFSLVIMHRASPDRIYIAKRGSPLVVGLADGETLIASDIPALLAHTQDMIFMEDGEMGVVTAKGAEFFDFAGLAIAKTPKRITWNLAQAQKGGYKHFMLKEIMEQPQIFADTLRGRFDQSAAWISFDKDADNLLNDFVKSGNTLQIIACGTSWHAGLVGAYWIESLARIPVKVDLASEFRYRKPLVGEKTLVVPISQSGETADTLAAVDESKSLGSKILAICNVIEASIPRRAGATIYTNAGPEIGVASTKAFLTQMAVLYLLALKLAALKGLMPQADLAPRLQAFVELPTLMDKVTKNTSVLTKIVEKLHKKEHAYFLGRGIQFPIALEGALKLKEISYIHAEGYAGGEMKHGPIALIEDDVPVVAMVLQDALYEKMVSNIEEVRARGAQVFPVISEDDDRLRKMFPEAMLIPKTHPDLLPFLSIIPLQLLSYLTADRKGTDVDQPRNLAKSVTVE